MSSCMTSFYNVLHSKHTQSTIFINIVDWGCFVPGEEEVAQDVNSLFSRCEK